MRRILVDAVMQIAYSLCARERVLHDVTLFFAQGEKCYVTLHFFCDRGGVA